MRRREFITLFGAASAMSSSVCPLAMGAQQAGKLPTVDAVACALHIIAHATADTRAHYAMTLRRRADRAISEERYPTIK